MLAGRQPVATILHNHKRYGHGQNSVDDARKVGAMERETNKDNARVLPQEFRGTESSETSAKK